MKHQSHQVSQVPPLSVARGTLRDHAVSIIAVATVLALLYVGRDVLIPLTLALMLSLLIATRRLEREAQRNLELMWLVGRLAPDF
jgi:predicted PurR-regulated permease PerM